MAETLEEYEIQWAYENWCIGYSIPEIAHALNVSEKTVSRAFERRKLKKRRPPLKPPKKCP